MKSQAKASPAPRRNIRREFRPAKIRFASASSPAIRIIAKGWSEPAKA